MSYVELALQHADRGWPAFPVQPALGRPADKSPYPGFTSWEQRASTDPDVIRRWWDRYPDALPAITPGRVKRVAIDVDRHPGKPNGYESLVRRQVHIPPMVPRYPSVSGSGLHYFYRGDVSSRNALYPGVDRKARGGYVVAVYDLVRVAEVRVPLPVPFHGPTRIDTTAEHPYPGNPDAWLAALSGSTQSPAVRVVLGDIAEARFTGHDNMLRVQAYLVHLGREGHGGVPEALEKARASWLNSPHASAEDPVREWDRALSVAITKFGGELES